MCPRSLWQRWQRRSRTSPHLPGEHPFVLHTDRHCGMEADSSPTCIARSFVLSSLLGYSSSQALVLLLLNSPWSELKYGGCGLMSEFIYKVLGNVTNGRNSESTRLWVPATVSDVWMCEELGRSCYSKFCVPLSPKVCYMYSRDVATGAVLL